MEQPVHALILAQFLNLLIYILQLLQTHIWLNNMHTN